MSISRKLNRIPRQHKPFNWQPGRLDKPEVLEIDEIAEKHFAQQFGERKIHTHLVKRDSESLNRFVVQPELYRFAVEYSWNFFLFYDVDLKSKEAALAGWLYGIEVVDNAEEEDFITIERNLLHSTKPPIIKFHGKKFNAPARRKIR